MQQLILIIEDQLTRDAGTTPISRRRHLIRVHQALIVGRDTEQADVSVASDSALSAAHFQISCQKDGCFLTDLGSRHGTSINGQKTEHAQLRDDDHILAGETRFVVQLIDVPPGAVVRPSVPQASKRDENATKDAAARRMRVELQIIHAGVSGDHNQSSQLFTTIFAGESLTVGRVPERAELSFPGDHELSGAHLELSCNSQGCRLRDLNSTNGTFLNGQPMHNLLLQNGDEIRAGRTYFIVHQNQTRAAPRLVAQQTISDIALTQELRKQARLASTGFRVINRTTFPVATLTGQINHPGHSLTIVVKGTFQLRPGQLAEILEEQPGLSGDIPFDGDEDPQKAPRYDGDFAFRKPRADILIAGHCHAPGGVPVRQIAAGIQVGPWSRSVQVCGPRFWKQERGSWTMTEPEPFQSLRLDYSQSFGGPESEFNPAGTGHYSLAQQRKLDQLPAPRIVSEHATPRTPSDEIPPAGLSPLGRWHGRRRQQLGTFDQSWEQHRFPWFPADFSWDHFNVAPEPLPPGEFLRGDEIVTLSHLHPEQPEYQTQLPCLRIRCFVNPLGAEFREVPLVLDTLWLDCDAEQAVLTWRGHSPVASEECEDLRHVFVLAELMDDPPRAVSDCHALMLEEISRQEAQFNPPPETPPEDAPANAEEDASANASLPAGSPEETAAAEQVRKFETELEQMKIRIRETQLAAGFDPELFESQVRAEELRLMRELGLDAEVPPAILLERVNAEYVRLRQQIHAAQKAAGHEPVVVPEVLLDLPELPSANQNGDDGAEPPAGVWTRERVIAHVQAGGSLAGEDLSGLNLSDLNLAGADFEAAILTGVQFSRSVLTGARFRLASLADCDLTRAQLQKTVLDHADFTGAVLHQASLDQAKAMGAIFASAWLTGASCQQLDAVGVYFTQADLTDATFIGAKLDQADFMDARMSRSDFRLASLVEATLETATGLKAVFDRANLTRVRAGGSDFSGSRFVEVRACDSIWEKARLTAADFSHAQLQSANFIRATLDGARLVAVDLSNARLNRASLKDAILNDSKLFEASAQQADFTDADLRRSNFYGAEVFGAVWDRSQRDDINWEATKLANTIIEDERKA